MPNIVAAAKGGVVGRWVKFCLKSRIISICIFLDSLNARSAYSEKRGFL